MSVQSSFHLPDEDTGSRPRIAKLFSLTRAVDNWPRTLADHVGLARSDYVCRLRNGLRFHVRGGTDDRHVIYEVFAEAIYPVELRAGSIVLDIGAHIGCFTLLAARQGAHVFGFEPFPSNFAALQRNLSLNAATRAVAFQIAVTGTKETRKMFVPDRGDYTGRFSLHPGRGAQTLEVPCKSLDQVIAENALDRIDLLKVDCQGSEYEILYGTAANTLHRIRAMVVECEVFDTPSHWSVTALQAYLESLEFQTTRRGNILYAAHAD